jgi:hypothetical protein
MMTIDAPIYCLSGEVPPNKHTAGAKALDSFVPLLARLKSFPDTKSVKKIAPPVGHCAWK